MNPESNNRKLWGGRFSEKTDLVLESLNASISYDKRMWKEDLKGSRAYTVALLRAGLLTEDESKEILKGLDMVHEEWEKNTFIILPSDEDIHTANERRLKELIGHSALKLHTGRSRNDQVVTDMRLWLRSGLGDFSVLLCDIIKLCTVRAQQEIDILMPGYTHLQRAQPVRWSHWLLSYCWSLKADHDRLKQLSERINVLPLGSGAIAGNPFLIDRQFLADELDFQHVSSNSMHAVGDRDFIVEFLFWASLTSIHLSRLAEDLILFSSQEFGFVTLSEAYSTGSSLMPQKRNPDSLEIIRGTAGKIYGHCTGVMMILKGLPSTYNKDLQEDKVAMFAVFDCLKAILQVAGGVINTLQVKNFNCRAALSPDMLATDVAYYLVKKGVSFREAHHLAGEVVAKAEQDRVTVSNLPLNTLRDISNFFEDDINEIWNYESSVEQYQVKGGTSRSSVTLQISELLQWHDNIRSLIQPQV
ncbi:hypothetical protein R5R35_006516 [Gryllus longicercus]|uniref:Arginosuccinase n=2 Tax=Gryllus longicercus TaxID=2509291 RepID=A0AAN9VDW6_9ORTH